MKKIFILTLPLLSGIWISCGKKASTDIGTTLSVKVNKEAKLPQANIRPEDCYDSMDDLLSWVDALYEPGDEITIKYLPTTNQYCIIKYSNVLNGKF